MDPMTLANIVGTAWKTADGIFAADREGRQRDYLLRLAELNQKTSLTAQERDLALKELQMQYQDVEQVGEEQTRRAWMPVLYLAVGGILLLVLVYALTR